MGKLFLISVACCGILSAQFGGPAKSVKTGATLPATCISNPAQLFGKTGTGAGLYTCVVGVWTSAGASACKTITVVSTNAAFQAASMTATVTLETLPAKAILTGMDIKHSVQYSDGGGAMSQVGVTVGSPAGGATFFSANQNIGEATAVADTTLLSTSLFKRATAASEALNAYFTATGQNFGDGAATFLTGGSVDIGYCYFVKP